MKKISSLLAVSAVILALSSCDGGAGTAGTTDKDSSTHANNVDAAKPGNPGDVKTDGGPFQIEPLKYGYADLEKAIDAKTMEVHFSKHYLGYANNLNKEVAAKGIKDSTIEALLKKIDMTNATLRNNGGGFYNHRLYFETMSPKGGGEPTGALAEAIKKDFGSFDSLKVKLSDAAAKRFGSGWAWLAVKDGKLVVGSTANQDNPLMPGLDIAGTPVLGIDVWEHAYYLRYQNKRPDYIKAFFDVVDWSIVNAKYEAAIKK